MAYDVTEERLKVKGSEQITRDLKVNRDAYINGSLNTSGDIDIQGQVIARDDVSISGDLYVNGTEYINDSETAQTTDDYLVLRHNQTTPLGTDEYSGVAVHNYASGKTATITTDKDGTWRVADNTETDTDYTNISYYNGTYYTGLTRTAATVISGMKTAFDEDELDESVYYNTSYYHFDGSHWFPVSLVDNKLTLGSVVTDSTTITALNALTKEDLVYFRTLTITVINLVENQPLLTRAESSDLTGGQALTWDATNQKAVGKTIDTTVTSGSSNLITSGAVKTAVDDEATARNTAITNAVNALDVTDTAVSGKYVSAVSETNGKISVARADLPNRVNNAYSINGQVSCDTAAATAAKTVTLAGFTLVKGAKLIVNVTNANTAASALTLNVNNTGAKTIRVNGVTTSSTSYTLSAGLYNCYYDGTYWSMESSYEGDSARLANFAYEADYSRSTAYCATDAGTAAKVASMREYVLSAGSFLITFSTTNTAASALTLNINSKGAKPIWINGEASSASNYTLPAGTYLCTYDGAEYLISSSGANIDTKMDRVNPTGTGSFSLDRKAGTTIGNNSFAEGFNTIASGNVSHAEGSVTIASGIISHAEGQATTASGTRSHAEGWNTTASGNVSHVEGYNTTASGEYQHVQGKYNVVSDTWAFVIGGGKANSRKNILAFDWDGNLHIFGDIYVHCNNDGTGGTKK